MEILELRQEAKEEILQSTHLLSLKSKKNVEKCTNENGVDRSSQKKN